jgi:hypothetical protein
VANETSSGKTPPAEHAAEAEASRQPDLALIHGVTEDGEGLRVIRRRGEALEAGAVRPLREGKPIHGELVKLHPRPECPLLCDIEVELPRPLAADGDRSTPKPTERRAMQVSERSSRGPAQVASELYRQNWDAIWARVAEKDLN